MLPRGPLAPGALTFATLPGSGGERSQTSPELTFLLQGAQTYPSLLLLLPLQPHPDFRMQLTSPSPMTFSLTSAPLRSQVIIFHVSLWFANVAWVTFLVLSSEVYVFKM